VDFSGGFILPVTTMLQRPFKFNSTGAGAIVNTAAAIPAFVGVQDNWRLAFLGIGYVYVYLADLDTVVAPVAYIRIENHGAAGGGYIGKGGYFFLRHFSLQKPVR
jgi:hypothetical protein